MTYNISKLELIENDLGIFLDRFQGTDLGVLNR